MLLEDYAKFAAEMRKWLNIQPHLPKDVPDHLLCRFVHSCYLDLDKAKRAADTFFTLRREHPHLFTDRDPHSPHMQMFVSAVNLTRLEISQRRKLWIYQMKDQSNFNLVADAKLNFLMNDWWLLENEEKFDENDVYYLVDLKDISFRFFAKLNISVLNVYSKYQREAIPIRLKQMHFVNTSPLINKLFSLFKHLLSKDISQSVYFHAPNSESLFRFFERHELPADYGGSLPSMDILGANTIKLIENKRDTILSEDFWVVKDVANIR